MSRIIKKSNFLIGVDGGGTKTIAALSDFEGKILKIAKSGSSHLRNLGLEKALKNVALAIKKVLPKRGKILSTFIGLPAVAEEYREKKEKIKRELKKYKEIKKIFEGKVKIGSDQEVALRAGTDGDGIMLNAGTGCVVFGKRGERSVHVSGWGYLGDEGGAYFVGQRAFQEILKQVDGRKKETILKNFVFKKLKVKNENQFLEKVYKNPEKIVPSLSVLVDLCSKRGDKVSKKILKEAAKEAALSAKTAIKKLNFQKENFPLVLNGSLFKSKIFLEKVKEEIKKFSPKAKFILLKKPPVIGAVKLALENLEKFDLIIFDLDGVLIDTKNFWLKVNQLALSKQGYKFSFKEIEPYLGEKVEEIFSNLIPKKDKKRKEKIKRAKFLAAKISSSERFFKKVKLFSFAKETLEKLKSKKNNLVLLTNSPRVFVKKILEKFSLKDLWKKVITAEDKFKKKEDAISFLIKKFKTKPERTVYIGDMVRDIKIAKKAGCKIISIPGWDSKNKLKREKPDFLIDSLKELSRII